jgi:formyltetrahydrofolate deformylase
VRRTAHVTVIGKDKSGVIARITRFLFECGGNIEELDQHVTHGLFTMHLEVSWPATGETADAMREGLEAIGRELDMDIEFRPVDDAAAEGPARIALLVTREEHAPRAVLEACAVGALDARVVLVAANKRDLAALAAEFDVPFHHVDDADKPAHEQALLDLLRRHDVDLVVLARYMRILSPNFVWRFPHRILNIHPSLLPAFPGAVPYRQAVERGVRVAGVTAHLVTVDLDQGPIVAQEAFDVPPGARVQDVLATGRAAEARVLVEAVRQWLDGLEVGWGRAVPRSPDERDPR